MPARDCMYHSLCKTGNANKKVHRLLFFFLLAFYLENKKLLCENKIFTCPKFKRCTTISFYLNNRLTSSSSTIMIVSEFDVLNVHTFSSNFNVGNSILQTKTLFSKAKED